MSIETFNSVLNKFRKEALSEREKGFKFEKLMQAYLKTTPLYANVFKKVWMWDEFPSHAEFGKNDVGIDLVAVTYDNEFWAIQCKCYQENTYIGKSEVDSFLSTSGKYFSDPKTTKQVSFSNRLWVSTTNNWSENANKTLNNQTVQVTRLLLSELENDDVDWLKLEKGIFGEAARVEQKKPFEHQETAINKAHEYFKNHNRGKLIMACGTGKTFTSLKIAEQETNNKGLVLFLVPSIALLGQTLREWSAQASKPINPICICSDRRVTQQRSLNDDDETFAVINLALPASTDVRKIGSQLQHALDKDGMTVVFSTYQSIDVISEAQQFYINNFTNKDEIFQSEDENKKGIFDLVICDEAHRTTGVTLSGQDESSFVKVHDNNFIKARKRIYMTATPRLYSDETKTKASQNDAILASMDDEAIYGAEIYRIGFGEAVDRNLLSDYKVLVLTVGDKDISPLMQRITSDNSGEINTDDLSKMVGCINALSKKLLGDAAIIKDTDPDPMRKAVAFCQNIKVSKATSLMFNECEPAYFEDKTEEEKASMVYVQSKHIDGSMSAPQRDELLSWLKSNPEDDKECRMLTNVRCLSEGVDVPSLDAVLFLSARNSQVDVVQSVGRVMRRAEGKKYGYIIIPVVVPEGVDASEALDKNPRFNVVWTVLNALRAHDDRFNATINKIELNKNKPAQILIGGIDNGTDGDGDGTEPNGSSALAAQLAIQFEELQSTFYAKMVQKVGNKRYWEQWAKDIAHIAEEHIIRIKKLIKEEGKHKKAFDEFIKGLRKNINPSVSEQEAIEMLSQHMITKPVFEALFENYSFVQNNPISKSMQKVMDLLDDEVTEDENEKLNKFYDSVRRRVKDIDNAEGKQKVIVELYDKFFKSAFPKVVEKLGIVYTPVEVVDFIINSVGYILQKEFGRSLSDENVHILDPFTGTGTFIARLLQSGLIKKEDLERKYTKELHANEIILLAYYIASINIENIYHDLSNDSESYKSFNGICLTDTFQLGEDDNSEKMFSEMFPQNSKRVMEQKKTPLRVIIGNPPYSVGQKSANDNAQNQSYERLDSRIADTYASESNASSVKAIYDSYIKAFRWASDRLDKKNGGVIAYITNSGWIDKGGADGMRKCLEKEFSSIYVFDLRGAIKGKSGDSAKREGQNVFDIMTGVAITILVKNPHDKNEKSTINYFDIGNYLSRKEKFDILTQTKSIANLDMEILSPNEHGDWINHRSDIFKTFIPIESAKKFDAKSKSFFTTYSLGIASSRDSWVYNFSKKEIEKNMNACIDFYNKQRLLCGEAIVKGNSPDSVIEYNPTKISWNDSLKNACIKNKPILFNDDANVEGFYRPFCHTNLYFERDFIQRPYQQTKLYPTYKHSNIAICVSGLNTRLDRTSVFITNKVTDLNCLDAGTQCFPLYWYEDNANDLLDLFKDTTTDRYIRRDAVSDFILKEARVKYGHKTIKEDIFYYVYGILHSPDYRTAFEADLKKMLPRLPLVDKSDDFWAFSKAGRDLANLHLNYETVEPYKGVEIVFGVGNRIDYRVDKMRFGKNGKETDKSTIFYNSQIAIHNIPLEAYGYIVNGKSAIEWIMERYAVTINKDSQIKNDPNDWSREHDDEKYIYNLLLRIITVSVETVKIVNGLPKLKF